MTNETAVKTQWPFDLTVARATATLEPKGEPEARVLRSWRQGRDGVYREIAHRDPLAPVAPRRRRRTREEVVIAQRAKAERLARKRAGIAAYYANRKTRKPKAGRDRA